MKKIVITGANGFLGETLIDFFLKKHPEFQIVAIARHFPEVPKMNVTYALWDGEHIGTWKEHFEHAEAIVNFAGKSVNCRYTAKNKAEILNSRLKSTWLIGQAIRTCKYPPKQWINSASATIYEHSLERPNNEVTGSIGQGFSVEVCKQWEATFFHTETPKTNKMALRTTIVLGKNGGVFPVLRNLAKWGLGGKMGTGNQQFSWIHVTDFCNALWFLLEHPIENTVVNLGSPNPTTNAHFQAILRKVIHRSFGLNLPEKLLKIGAVLMRTETELVLKSRYIEPKTLLEKGFCFRYPTIEKCLKELAV